MAININKAVDKAFETKTLKEIADAPVSALEGLGDAIDKALAPVGIKSIRELADWKVAAAATALATLAATEKKAEIDGKSAKDLVAASLEGFEGISADLAKSLGKQGLKTVGDLAAWKYIGWARAITTLAALAD